MKEEKEEFAFIGSEFVDGWEGFTKTDLKEMYNTNTAQYPVWVMCSTGLGFDPIATLKANGLHPGKIPEALRNHCIAGPKIKKIAEHYPLKYVHTPE